MATTKIKECRFNVAKYELVYARPNSFQWECIYRFIGLNLIKKKYYTSSARTFNLKAIRSTVFLLGYVKIKCVDNHYEQSQTPSVQLLQSAGKQCWQQETHLTVLLTQSSSGGPLYLQPSDFTIKSLDSRRGTAALDNTAIFFLCLTVSHNHI